MKIIFLTHGSENLASSRTRVFQYLPYFKNKEIKYFVHQYLPKTNLNLNYKQAYNQKN